MNGVPATSVVLDRPAGVAVDALRGDVYFSTYYNPFVYRVDQSGTIFTFAGNGRYDTILHLLFSDSTRVLGF